MSDLDPRIGAFRYDTTEALFDGRVAIDGVDATLDTSPLISEVSTAWPSVNWTSPNSG